MNKLKSAIEVSELGQYATILVVIGILLGIGSLIMTTMQETEQVSPVLTYNESVTLVNGSFVALTKPRLVDVTEIGNGTNYFKPIGSANYTHIGNRSGSMVNLTYTSSAGLANFSSSAPMYVVYTYQDESVSYDVLDSTNDSIGVIGDWLSIIAIVVVAVVILALIKYL